MSMGIDASVSEVADAFRGNPNALAQRYSIKQELIDLLALQKLKSEKEATAKELAMQAGTVLPTVAQQREQELFGLTRDEVAKQVGGVAQKQAADAQQNMARLTSGGLGALPAPTMTNMRSGGIVPSYADGGRVVQPPRNAAQVKDTSLADPDVSTFLRMYQAYQQAMQQAVSPQDKQLIQKNFDASTQNISSDTKMKAFQYLDSTPKQPMGMAGGGVVRFDGGGYGDLESAMTQEGITDPELKSFIRAVYAQESSSGRNTKDSPRGAIGSMQVTPAAFTDVADRGWNIRNPEHNLRAGIRYAARAFDKSGGDPQLAGAYYFGGPGGFSALRDRGVAKIDPSSGLSTRDYGRRINQRMNEEQNLPWPEPASYPTVPEHIDEQQYSTYDTEPSRQITNPSVLDRAKKIPSEIGGGIANAARYYFPTFFGKDDIGSVGERIGRRAGDILQAPGTMVQEVAGQLGDTWDALGEASPFTLGDVGNVVADVGRGILRLPSKDKTIPESPVPSGGIPALMPNLALQTGAVDTTPTMMRDVPGGGKENPISRMVRLNREARPSGPAVEPPSTSPNRSKQRQDAMDRIIAGLSQAGGVGNPLAAVARGYGDERRAQQARDITMERDAATRKHELDVANVRGIYDLAAVDRRLAAQLEAAGAEYPKEVTEWALGEVMKDPIVTAYLWKLEQSGMPAEQISLTRQRYLLGKAAEYISAHTGTMAMLGADGGASDSGFSLLDVTP